MVDNDGVGGRCGVMDARRRSGTAGATIRPRPERNAASTRATRPSPPTRRPARSSPDRRSTPPANTDTASRRTMSTMPHDRCEACLRRPVNYAQDITPEVCNLPPEWRLFHGREYPGEKEALCSFSLPLLILRRLLLSPSALDLASGALSICWRAMDRTTRVPMLMCGKVTH